MFQRKFVDFKSAKFPEINPVKMTAMSKNKEVKIVNYRFPSQSKD